MSPFRRSTTYQLDLSRFPRRPEAEHQRHGLTRIAKADATVTDPRPITIVVPVYNAPRDVRVCLESVVANTAHPGARLLVVDDASPDPAIAPMLADFAARYERVEVVTNEINLGFLGTCNHGFALTASADVLLLNSDTVVPPRWLMGMSLAAAESEVGTVTALSNNAWAFSVPAVNFNEMPGPIDPVGRAIRQTSERRYPETPMGHGFCLLIKREVLDATGGFDPVFGRGYHEETDLSMRAAAAGWRHVVDDATFVEHTGSVSFSGEKADLLIANRAIIDDRHPEYGPRSEQFLVSDEMAAVRARVDALWNAAIGATRPRVLVVGGPVVELAAPAADLAWLTLAVEGSMASVADEQRDVVDRFELADAGNGLLAVVADLAANYGIEALALVPEGGLEADAARQVDAAAIALGLPVLDSDAARVEFEQARKQARVFAPRSASRTTRTPSRQPR
ncbi:MAG: glycosyltransferase [Acidimicrobiales bacterium]|nr:glycosyltransferase [Acidimicrobiales bacterium]